MAHIICYIMVMPKGDFIFNLLVAISAFGFDINIQFILEKNFKFLN